MGETSTSTVPATSTVRREYKLAESLISAISVGFVFILFGLIYVLALPSNLLERMVAFFGSLNLRQVPGMGISLPAPVSTGAHAVFYTAVFQFCIGVVLLELLVLALRLIWNSPIRRTAETIGNLVFWLGTAFLANTFLNAQTTVNTWFAFWSGILIAVGLSMIARAAILLIKK